MADGLLRKASRVKKKLLFPFECQHPHYKRQRQMFLNNSRDSEVKASEFCGCEKASEITGELSTP